MAEKGAFSKALRHVLSHPVWAGIGGIVGIIGVIVAVVFSVPEGGDGPMRSPDSEVSTPPPLTARQTESPTPSGSRVIDGNWRKRAGELTVTVFKVEKNLDDYLRLHVRVDNAASHARTLPLTDENFDAVDNTGKTYERHEATGESQWPGNAPARGSFTGVIALETQIEPSATSLTISFDSYFGFGASPPPGGIKVTGIVLPS